MRHACARGNLSNLPKKNNQIMISTRECFTCKYIGVPLPKGKIEHGEWVYDHSICSNCGAWFAFKWLTKIKKYLMERV
jgi:hypothetical protein